MRSAEPAPKKGFPGPTPRPGSLDRAALEEILGTKGREAGGVVKFSFARTTRMHGVEAGGSMGVSTRVSFSGSDELAAIACDFAMTAREVQPVLRALRGHGIHIVALHNHMVGDSPPIYFTHFWAKGPARELAKAFRAVLEAERDAGSGR